jgi:hypothetical protein
MKADLLGTVLYVCGFAAAGLQASAAPLQRSDVPAELAWVLHVDCDGLRPTAIGQYLMAEMAKPEGPAMFDAFQTLFNFDPQKQLHGLTLYSTGQAADDRVLLVYADFDPDRLITLARAAKDYQSTPYKQHVIHNWIDEKRQARHGGEPRVYAAIQNGQIVVYAQQEAWVAHALEVLDRATPTLAGSGGFAQLGAGGSNSLLQASARKLDLADSDPGAVFFRLAKMGRLQIGEVQGQLKGALNVEANDNGVARLMAWVGQGVLALLKLQKGNPSLAKLAEALALKQDGTTVVVSLAMPTDEAIGLMKADAARKARKKAGKD